MTGNWRQRVAVEPTGDTEKPSSAAEIHVGSCAHYVAVPPDRDSHPTRTHSLAEFFTNRTGG